MAKKHTLIRDINISKDKLLLLPTYSCELTTYEIKNIKDTILFLIEAIDYHTPTDRCFIVNIEIQIKKNLKMHAITTITPCYRGVLKSNSKENAEELHRFLRIVSDYSIDKDDFKEGGLLQKHIKWALDYFGLTIMYGKQHQEIRITFTEQRYNIIYA